MTTSQTSLKQFAYNTAKLIQSECNFNLSRSHIYELLACYEGYQSYNGFLGQNLLINVSYDNSQQYYQHKLLNALTLNILKDLPTTDDSGDDWENDDVLHWDDYEGREFLYNIQRLITRLNSLSGEKQSKVFLFDLVKVIYREFLFLNFFYMNLKSVREALSNFDFENGLLDDDIESFTEYGDEYLIECNNGEYFSFTVIQQNLEGLNKFAALGNKDAIAIIAKYYLYLANQIAPYGGEGSNFGAVWDNQKMRYTNTTQAKLNRKKFDDLVRLSQQYQKMIENSPLNISEVNFDQTEITKVQLKYLANQGDIKAIDYLLYNKLFQDDIEAWVYIYVAQALGEDFTQDDYHAINAYTGEPYDDYGPLEVVGRGAIQHEIHLAKLNDEDQRYALQRVQEILNNIK
ncbi:hypothetical protein GCM10023206_33910 [Acinetobacter puyangensis]|uniref:Uncharacterized protein n=1 Tax=Acinetobacter puyangensis TaxID=1096779 RepID=A0A240EEW9_9GAMM|nr:hypothetical protein [Acinetobacter puyangensis]SNX46515.1 hypothetical protein SAMN05421731_11284 [Acinetobacter puyangensis]